MTKKTKTVVSLFTYGGGMRGLVPAHIMAQMEYMTGLRMSDMVDIFAGPSTGAILNAALNVPSKKMPGRPKYRAQHLVKFYEREGIKIFPDDSYRSFRGIIHDFNNRTLKLSQMNKLLRHGHYDPSYLSYALQRLYGDTNLEDSLSSLIIPTYNIDGAQIRTTTEEGETEDSPTRTKNNVSDEGGHAVWLKNIRTNQPIGTAHNTPHVSLYNAVMGSCAAPTYFPCHHMNVQYPDERGIIDLAAIDGVIFDNPCISYLGAIRRHIPADTQHLMIILGTGYTNKSVKKEDWNRYGSLGVVDPVNDLPLINIFFHASESALMDSFSEEMGNNLHIFNKSMIPILGHPDAPNTLIDDASPKNIKGLKWFAEEIMEENKSALENLCHLLVANHQNKQGAAEKSRKFFSFLSRGK